MIKCCLACDQRVIGCHANCEKYIEEHNKHEAEKELERKAHIENGYHMYGIPGKGDTKYRRRRKLQYYARGGHS